MTVVHPRRPGCPRRSIAMTRRFRTVECIALMPRFGRDLGSSDCKGARAIGPHYSQKTPTPSMQLAMRSYGIFRWLSFRRVSSIVRRFQSVRHSVVSCFSRSHPTLTPPPSRSPAPPLPVSQSQSFIYVAAPPLSPPPSLTVDGSALRLRSCLPFNASEYNRIGPLFVRSALIEMHARKRIFLEMSLLPRLLERIHHKLLCAL